jgi:hypothetical protein
MHQEKLTERKNIVGVYCILTRGASVNQRWTVKFLGEEIGKFRTRSLAKQFAEARIWAAMRDIVHLEDSI